MPSPALRSRGVRKSLQPHFVSLHLWPRSRVRHRTIQVSRLRRLWTAVVARPHAIFLTLLKIAMATNPPEGATHVVAMTRHLCPQRIGFVWASYFRVGFGLELPCVQFSILVPGQVFVHPALQVCNVEKPLRTKSFTMHRHPL